MQKVPLTLDRENVTGRFLNVLRTAVFNETHKSLDTEAVNHEWAQIAIESDDAKPEAVVDYMTKRFGENRASYTRTTLKPTTKLSLMATPSCMVACSVAQLGRT